MQFINVNRVLWVPNTEVQNHKRKLNSRFKIAKTVKETRIHHSYVPIPENNLEMKITSFDTDKEVFEILQRLV